MASSDVFDNFDLDTGSPPRPQRLHKKTWQELRSVVRETRKTATRVSPSVPNNFVFGEYEDESGNPVTRLYFLGSLEKGRDSTLLRADLTDNNEFGHRRHHRQDQGHESMMSTTPTDHNHSHMNQLTHPSSLASHRLAADSSNSNTSNNSGGGGNSNEDSGDDFLLSIQPVFSSQPSSSSTCPSSSSASTAMSKEEILLRERKRMMSYGITSYDFDHEDKVFVIPANNSLYVCNDELDTPCVPQELPTQTYGARLDPKICPCNSDLVAFIHEADVWLSVRSSGKEFRMTHVHRGCVSMEDDPMSAGVPSFVIQEEFDRYTGYWWSPTFDRLSDGRRVYRILYEEVDESSVEVLSIFSPTGSGSSTDKFRYPRAGTNNASSSLKLLEITVNYNSQTGDMVSCQELCLKDPLFTMYPWAEYMTRAGWTADGRYVYATLLDRLQERQAIVLISPDSFHPESPYSQTTPQTQPGLPEPRTYCIYQETSHVWINVHDCLHFFPQTCEDRISFLHVSESSGFRHLYHVTSSLTKSGLKPAKGIQPPPPPPPHSSPPQPASGSDSDDMDQEEEEDINDVCAMLEHHAVTQGAWIVLPKMFWVDEARQLVFFIGLKDTPLESHLYVTRYTQPGSPIVRLTTMGYSHTVQLSKDCTKFVTVFSSLESPAQCKVYSLQHSSAGHDVSACTCIGTLSPPVDTLGYIPPTPFQYLSQAGHTSYGLYLRPHGMEEGRRYPTVLFVYGGPQVQMVTNSFKGQKFLRLHALAAEGYMVVVIDGRGSNNRGLHFEGCLKHKLGTVEINDQVEGLLWLTNKTNCIDLSRVAIHGWSYGGYLSLMGITQRKDIFKVAIAGAPVVDWELYDTGYTERYLGLPHSNQGAYKNGNVLSYIDSIPDSDTRLLLIHGLIDENVHFHHSNVLINAMVSSFKPIQLQVYPNERHGIRSHDAIEHYKTTVLKFLQDQL